MADQTFCVGERVLKLAPFSIEQAEEALTLVEALRAVKPDEAEVSAGKARLAHMVDVVVIGLRESEPDAASKEWVRKNVRFAELGALYAAVLAASGLSSKEPAAGEAKGP
jgi:hypothetical protein